MAICLVAARHWRIALVLLAALVAWASAIGYLAAPASAHRSGCHSKHECPSDHATYRWGPKRLLCVKPSSDKRNATFKLSVRYAGLPYLCKR